MDNTIAQAPGEACMSLDCKPDLYRQNCAYFRLLRSGSFAGFLILAGFLAFPNGYSGRSSGLVVWHYQVSVSPRPRVSASPPLEYLWYETENMRGISEAPQHEPVLNPSWMDLPAANAPGWGISGPGVSAEWSQGGESEWNSVAASADETRGAIWQDLEVPRAGDYKIWVRYADWAYKTENFAVSITQD